MNLRLWPLVILLAGCGARPTLPKSGAPTVVLISMDGMRHDYARRAPTPNLDRLAREGAKADRLIPPYPSQTFSAHASLATGVSAEQHGILNNRFFDRVKGQFAYDDEATWYDRPPLWVHATRAGLRTHVFHWVGNAGPYEGVSPAEVRLFDKSITDDEKVGTILDWLRADERPRLVMSYFSGCDKIGHEEGPEHTDIDDCVQDADDRVGDLLEGFAELPYPVALFLVSDHGMTNTQGEIDVYKAFSVLDFGVNIVASGPVAHVFVDPKHRTQTEELAFGIPHVTTYRGKQVPEEFGYRHPTRTGDLVLMADYGWHFNTKKAGKGMLPGHHGHDPTKPEMGAIFYAWGYGVKPGARLSKPRAVDLFPTICALLGLPVPAHVEGRALDGLFKPGRAPKR